jgi:hypothetical protein
LEEFEMEFFVLYDEKNELVYSFKDKGFLPRKDVNEGCFLPSIGMAYRILKHDYMFLNKPLSEIVKPKKIKVIYKGKIVYDESVKNNLEVSWC